ncbi:hypothetical protein [Methylophaga pinxianii]|uniref:hypothetical protein n=1 Tax=Methylophaga pinxianii TaxID=2881052 RepID=UPI001CF39DEA|nr:hypothetical protein [Methylophaga pinxianii]MCB2427465.1 hypothetical protein [Methylophaga pinxianii]UPH44746.1 hypothetical protein LGT42_009490 [Methylophaga pinxianii]
MLKQLFLSTALATAFAATPVLADDHEKMNKDDPEWDQKVNKTENHADNNTQHKDKSEGETKTYDNADRDDKSITPDKKAYDKDEGNAKHPAHEMGDGDPVREQGQ